MSEFELGDVVSHKSVMFPMVVVEIEDDIVSCEWFVIDYPGNMITNQRVIGCKFHSFSLKKVDSEQVGW